ncbi:hypothetical protein CYMTET_34575, partial [Cymbomonas tetramitiformis]
EMDVMAGEKFFRVFCGTGVDGVLSIDELAQGFGQLFVNDFKNTPLTLEEFKIMIVKPVHALMLAGKWGDVTYDQYKTFMDLRIALREHIKESAGTMTQNQQRKDLQAELEGHEIGNIKSPPMLSFWEQFFVLLHRLYMIWMKDPKGVRAQLGQGIAIPLVLVLVYWDQDRTQSNYDNMVSCAFLTLMFSGLMAMNVTVLAFPLERVVVTREYSNGCYDMLPFFMSKALFLCLSKDDAVAAEAGWLDDAVAAEAGWLDDAVAAEAGWLDDAVAAEAGWLDGAVAAVAGWLDDAVAAEAGWLDDGWCQWTACCTASVKN